MRGFFVLLYVFFSTTRYNIYKRREFYGRDTDEKRYRTKKHNKGYR